MTRKFSLSLVATIVGATMLMVLGAACGETETITKTVEVPGETVIVEKEVIKEVEVAGETVIDAETADNGPLSVYEGKTHDHC